MSETAARDELVRQTRAQRDREVAEFLRALVRTKLIGEDDTGKLEFAAEALERGLVA